MEIAVIGAGLAGLTCVRALVEAGHHVSVFDKSRGPGGRMSSRRAETPFGQVRFDHGAQHFAPVSEAFGHAVDDWVEAGVAGLWDANFVRIGTTGDIHPAEDKPRYVGIPSMNAIVKHLADGLDVQWGQRVTAITGAPHAWSLDMETGEASGLFDAVLIAVPVEQAGPLLQQPAPHFAEIAASVTSDPCWTVMLAFDEPLEAPFDAARYDSGAIGWAARNGSKPGRNDAETWVLQAHADWSREHLEDTPEVVCAALIEAFSPPADPIHAAAHRWRYSQVVSPAGAGPSLWDPERGIGTCGDWLAGRNLEQAWLSGRSLAQTILT